jgi:hypothetical protein
VLGGKSNAKNVWITASSISGFQIAVFSPLGGVMTVADTAFASNGQDIHGNGAILSLRSLQSEGSTSFLQGTPTLGPASIENCEWNGLAASDDYVINYYPSVDIKNSLFYNGRTMQSEARIRSVGMTLGNYQAGGISVTNTIFAQTPVGAYPPIYNCCGSSLESLVSAGLSAHQMAHAWNNFRMNTAYAGGVSRLTNFGEN